MKYKSVFSNRKSNKHHIPYLIGKGWAVVLLASLLLSACATRKDRFINRQWHGLNTKYNVVFNGELAFENAWQNLQNGYEENFWEPLPIERFVISDQASEGFPAQESPFSLAEEKAVKAIKTHGMTIKGEEKNAQMVAAYSLLGRARYFDQRFVPALEAFNYIIRRYPASNKLNEVRIWKEKTNIRLGNEEVALENIKRLLKYRKLKGQSLANAYAVRAQAYLSFNAIDSASWDLKRALQHTKKPIEKARYAYILGQMYQSQQRADSALWAYERVVALNRRIPRVFLVQARLQRLYLKAKAGNTDKEAIEALTKMEKNWENKPFLDRILYEKSQLLAARGQDSLAIVYAEKSLKASKQDPIRNAENFRLIAAIHFEKAAYEKAFSYYDSLSQNLMETSIDYRRTLKKMASLKQLALFYKQAVVSDSLLALAALEPAQQQIFVSGFIKSAQEKDSLTAIKHTQITDFKTLSEYEILKAKLSVSPQTPKRSEETEAIEEAVAIPVAANVSNLIGSTSSFYFYNPQAVANGKLAFASQWGNRALADNWRWLVSPKTPENSTPVPPKNLATNLAKNSAGKKTQDTSEAPSAGGANKGLTIATAAQWAALELEFLAAIPSTKTAIDSLHVFGERAYFQLGTLYADTFNRPDLTVESLLPLYNKPPMSEDIAAVSFALYKAYERLGSYEAEVFKSSILKNFPETEYAALITNPGLLTERQQQFEARYDSLYKKYIDQNFTPVMAGTTQMLSTLLEDAKAAQVALLQANTIGRLYGYPAYKSALKALLVKYPNTPIAATVEKRLETLEAQAPTANFSVPQGLDRWYVALLFSENYIAAEHQAYLATFSKNFPAYSIQREVFAPGKTFYLVSGFENKLRAAAFAENNFFNENPLPDQAIFVILGTHYKTLQLFKNLKAYNDFVAKEKTQ